MCVIMVATKVRPTEEMVAKGFAANDAGAGIAWRERKKDGSLEVVWKKGLEEAEVTDLVAKLPLPFTVHFRIPTVGGRVKELCHPFPITRDVSLSLSGRTDGFVMFHNGHWNSWKASSLENAQKFRVKVPTGKWSDSRAMAWAAHCYGIGILEFIDEKAIAFGTKDIEVFGSGWTQVNDVWVSNTHWVNRGTYHTTPPFSMGGSRKEETAPKIDSKADVKQPGSGGNSADVPFSQVLQDYRDGKLSRTQFKKRKKALEKKLRKELHRQEKRSKKGR